MCYERPEHSLTTLRRRDPPSVKCPLLFALALVTGSSLVVAPRVPADEATRQLESLEQRFKADRQPRKFAPSFLDLARQYPRQPEAVVALTWVLRHFQRGPEAEQALELLAANHAASEQLLDVFQRVGRNPSLNVGQLYRAALKSSKVPEIQAHACMRLTEFLLRQLQLKEELGNDQAKIKRYEQFMSKVIVEHVRSLDTDKVLAECEQLCQRVLRDFADLKTFQGRMGDIAKRNLFQIQHLSIGRRVDDIRGEDVAGKGMQLADYRGKVVVIDFWADWCISCRMMYNSNRELVQKMADRPFALLGVNSDRNRQQTLRVIRTQGINWRSWWDGGSTRGPIATKWNVQTWPAIYVIDHKGVIRYKNLKGAELQQAVEQLVQEAEQDGS